MFIFTVTGGRRAMTRRPRAVWRRQSVVKETEPDDAGFDDCDDAAGCRLNPGDQLEVSAVDQGGNRVTLSRTARVSPIEQLAGQVPSLAATGEGRWPIGRTAARRRAGDQALRTLENRPAADDIEGMRSYQAMLNGGDPQRKADVRAAV
jgi:hypothetical protein